MNSAVTKLTVYPNPVQQAIHTSFVTDKNMQVVFSLFSLNGKLLQTYLRTASPGSNFYQLDLSSGLPAGSYILSADYGEGNSIQTKIIKQ
jgi:hypothetical protein